MLPDREIELLGVELTRQAGGRPDSAPAGFVAVVSVGMGADPVTAHVELSASGACRALQVGFGRRTSASTGDVELDLELVPLVRNTLVAAEAAAILAPLVRGGVRR